MAKTTKPAANAATKKDPSAAGPYELKEVINAAETAKEKIQQDPEQPIEAEAVKTFMNMVSDAAAKQHAQSMVSLRGLYASRIIAGFVANPQLSFAYDVHVPLAIKIADNLIAVLAEEQG